MAIDEELFFARRLGYGLKRDETVGASIRDWAIKQLSEAPPLDYYGPDNQNLRHLLPPLADPIPDYQEASRLVGLYYNKTLDLEAKQDTMPPQEFGNLYSHEVNQPQNTFPTWREALLRTLTAVNGPSPVFERFWQFWVNHFAIKAENMSSLWYGPHTRLIRSHMTGTFAQMLQDAELQPAMLFYLDNFSSTGPHSPGGRQNDGETINENLARELFELHTMSPAGEYTQRDIIETSYALSGWGFYSGQRGQTIRKMPTGVLFDIDRHEPGKRIILGKTYGTGNKGRDQAPKLIADLAIHPATAQFLSWKLVRHFVADDPPDDSVGRVKDAFIQSGGDMKTIHIAVVDEVLAKGHDTEKFTTPVTWLHMVHRTTDAPVSTTPPASGTYWIDLLLAELGQGYNTSPQPNGFSDLKNDWTSKELLERRVRYAYMTSGRTKGEMFPFLSEYAVRLAGADSDLVSAMSKAEAPLFAVTILLASPQFMRT
jgi:uncharacterized protein (DUF1800 family)